MLPRTFQCLENHLSALSQKVPAESKISPRKPPKNRFEKLPKKRHRMDHLTRTSNQRSGILKDIPTDVKPFCSILLPLQSIAENILPMVHLPTGTPNLNPSHFCATERFETIRGSFCAETFELSSRVKHVQISSPIPKISAKKHTHRDQFDL